MNAFPSDKVLDRIHERQTQEVHGQIDCAATTELCALVVPLHAYTKYLRPLTSKSRPG